MQTVTRMFALSPAHACAALELCASLVHDMQPPAGNFDRMWRKRCLAFRDSALQVRGQCF